MISNLIDELIYDVIATNALPKKSNYTYINL